MRLFYNILLSALILACIVTVFLNMQLADKIVPPANFVRAGNLNNYQAISNIVINAAELLCLGWGLVSLIEGLFKLVKQVKDAYRSVIFGLSVLVFGWNFTGLTCNQFNALEYIPISDNAYYITSLIGIVAMVTGGTFLVIVMSRVVRRIGSTQRLLISAFALILFALGIAHLQYRSLVHDGNPTSMNSELSPGRVREELRLEDPR